METQPALVRADGAVHLDTESAVDLNFSPIVKPGNAEHDYALRFGDSFEDFRRAIFWMLLQHQPKRIQNFLHCLVEFRFGRVFSFYGG